MRSLRAHSSNLSLGRNNTAPATCMPVYRAGAIFQAFTSAFPYPFVFSGTEHDELGDNELHPGMPTGGEQRGLLYRAQGERGPQNWFLIALYMLDGGALSDDYVLDPVKAVKSAAKSIQPIFSNIY